MSSPKVPVSFSESRYAVILFNTRKRKPVGLLIADSSQAHARGFCKHFNRRIKPRWPDRRALLIPVL